MSLCYEPRSFVPSKPDPNSNPFVAGRESIAMASKAGSLSKQGSPRLTGGFLMTQLTIPPIESCIYFILRIFSIIKTPVSMTGHRTLTMSKNEYS